MARPNEGCTRSMLKLGVLLVHADGRNRREASTHTRKHMAEWMHAHDLVYKTDTHVSSM